MSGAHGSLRSGECPGVAVGQFFQRREDVYAILLHTKRKTISREQLVVLRLREDRVETHIADEWQFESGEHVNKRYLKELKHSQADELLDTLIHELIHANDSLPMYLWDAAISHRSFTKWVDALADPIRDRFHTERKTEPKKSAPR